jgi:hypothetical protein
MLSSCVRRFLPVLVCIAGLVSTARAVTVPETCYLFAYFTDETGGLRLAWSADGYTYSVLNNGASYVVPSVGENKLMRDPSIVLGPDNVFRLVWTTGWSGKTIGYASSTDLKTWSSQKAIPLWSGHADEANVKTTWAPEITYDEANARYLIVWASNITGKYDSASDTSNPRPYATTTTDFTTFTSPRLFFEPGYDVIDATFFKDSAGRFQICFKDETSSPTEHLYLQLASSPALDGTYTNITPANSGFTPAGLAAEGPTVVRIGDVWVVFYDAYRAGHYSASRSTDLVNWTDITSQISIPSGAHHGTIIQVPGSFITNLLPTAAPAAPAGLTATAGYTEVALSWSASNQATSYNLKRATQSGGPYTNVATGLTTTTTTDAATAGVTYYYVVTAVNDLGESAPSTEVSAVSLAPVLRARLAFDESSGTTASDSTGNGWSGTLTNGPLWSTGKSGNAVNLDGTNDYVKLPSGVLSGLKGVTFVSWVNLDAAKDWSRIFDFGTGTSAYMFLTPKTNSGNGGTMRFGIKASSSSTEQTISGTAAVSTAAWVHVAVALSGRVGILYVNGSEVGRNSAITLRPADLGTTTQNWLGRSQFSADPYLDGRVDDFRIYAGALSASEIASVYSPLTAPQNVTATSGNGQATLSWSSVTNAARYKVKRASASGGPYADITTSTATSYTDTGLTNGTLYYYVVSAANNVGESAVSTETSVVPNPAAAKLTGTIIGTAGSFNNADNTIAKVFDGSLTTFFDGPTANGCWAGLDLGGRYVVSQVKYCPRSTNPARMTGGVFQGANTADFSDAVTLLTVSTQPTTGSLTARGVPGTTAYRYVRYLSPNGGWGNVAEVEFYGYSPLTPQEIWRQTHFGTTEATGNAADDADPDGDGLTNVQEFTAGTDPNDSSSLLKVNQLEVNGTDIIVSFPTVTGKTYRVEVSTTLQIDSWITLQSGIVGSGGTMQVTDVDGAAQPRRFYRLVVSP